MPLSPSDTQRLSKERGDRNRLQAIWGENGQDWGESLMGGKWGDGFRVWADPKGHFRQIKLILKAESHMMLLDMKVQKSDVRFEIIFLSAPDIF